MKKPIYYLVFLTVIVGMLFTSCVSNKKFMASEARVDQLQKENATTQEQLMKLKGEKAILEQEFALIQKDLLANSSASKMTIDEQQKRLNNLQDVIDSQTEITNRLKTSIANALMNYKADELSVYLKDGNVYVSLSENLLFKSGSDVVDPKGKEALKSLAKVLNSSKDFTVSIEGHTDDIPIQTKTLEDNWDLSTARATSIVRLLTNEYGFDSERITASGRSKFHPVDTNSTEEGRARNRRTEIILSPDLQEIYELLYE